MADFTKDKRPDINIADQGDGSVRTYIIDSDIDSSAYGSDINEELFVTNQPVDTYKDLFPVDTAPSQPPGLMWWAKDLEMYIPHYRYYVHKNHGKDGGFKMYVFSSDSDLGEGYVGSDVEAAFESGQQFDAGYKAKDLSGKLSIEYFGTNKCWLPVYKDGTMSHVKDKTQYMILDHGIDNTKNADDFDQEMCYPIVEDFFSPPIYEYTTTSTFGNNYDKYHAYFQYDINRDDSYYFRFGDPIGHQFSHDSVKNPSAGTSNKYNGGKTFIDDSADFNNYVFSYNPNYKYTSNGDTVSYRGGSQYPFGWSKMAFLEETIGADNEPLDGQSELNEQNGPDIRNIRNCLMPYFRDIIVKTNTHLNGGSFRQSTDMGYGYGGNSTTKVTSTSTGQGAFGRRRRSGYFDITEAFPTSLHDLSMKGGAPEIMGYIYIAVQVAHEAGEAIGDDATNSRWSLFKVSLNDIYKFLNTKDAQFLVLRGKATLSAAGDMILAESGMYNSKREKLVGVDNVSSGDTFVASQQDNFGVGDESTTWPGDDKRDPGASNYELVVVFRKPNPFRMAPADQEQQNVIDLQNNLIRLGLDNYNHGHVKGDNLFKDPVLGYPSSTGYVPYHIDGLKYSLNPGHMKNYGFFEKASTGPVRTETDSFTPMIYSYTIDRDDEITNNQVYYNDETNQFVKTSIPANVGFSCDIFMNETLIEQDPNLLNFTEFSQITRQGIDHYVNSDNIGFKWAMVDEEVEDRLDVTSIINKVGQLYYNPNSVVPLIKRGLYDFKDIFTLDVNGELAFSQLNKSYQTPGLHLVSFLVFKYHLIDLAFDPTGTPERDPDYELGAYQNSQGNIKPVAYIQPIDWQLVTVSHFLTSTGYYIEDFSELGGPGFTTLPFPRTTPIISGLTPSSKYLRSVDDIFDANEFTAPQILDKIKIKNVVKNEELGDYLGDSDVGQTRLFKQSVRMRDLLDVDENSRPFYDYDYYNGEPSMRYPTKSAATTVFIDNDKTLRDKCIVEVNPGEQTKGMLRDSSGNENSGILIGDYELSKEDRDTELTKKSNMKIPVVGKDTKAF